MAKASNLPIIDNEILIEISVTIKHSYFENKSNLTHQQISKKVCKLLKNERKCLAAQAKITTIKILDGDFK